MNHTQKAAFGIFRDQSEINKAVHILNSRGFTKEHISVLLPKHDGSKDFPQWEKRPVKSGAFIGALIGAVLFAVIGWLVSIRSIPFIGFENLLNTVSPSMIVITFLIGGLSFGAMSGALVGIGTPESISDRYSTYLHVGGILLSVEVHNDKECKRAKEILEKSGGQDIHLLDKNNGWRAIYGKAFQ